MNNAKYGSTLGQRPVLPFSGMFGIALALLASPALAGNFTTCLLDKLPGVQNPLAAQAAVQVCASDYPVGLDSVPLGSGRGLFADYDSSDQCILEKSSGIQQVRATGLIRMACEKLYRAPNFFDQFDNHP